MDPACPARRFALHCLYIYAADGIRTNFRAHPKRRFRKLVEQAERTGDEPMRIWAHNSRVLLARPDLFVYRDWCEGGLVRQTPAGSADRAAARFRTARHDRPDRRPGTRERAGTPRGSRPARR